MLWPLSVFVLLMAFFPNYVGTFLSDGTHIEASDIAYSISIEGMTCEACATHVVSELEKVPGVAKADVRYDTKLANVSVDGNNKPNSEDLLNAIQQAGYTGTISVESKTVPPKSLPIQGNATN